jgi:outer membrane protein assembly factor BamE (lipoprotein component of BamABCDE complex)
MKLNKIIFLSLFVFIISGCMTSTSTTPLTDKNSQLTQGNVQMNLVVGETSKAQVLENFGSPNVTTRDGSGKEVWSYQRAAQVSQSSSKEGYWSIIIAGQSSSAAGLESSSKMITLIIKFDANDIVYDFKSRESIF